MNDPKKTIKELHARLHQKALELRDGKAFANPNFWHIKLLKKYKTWHKFIRYSICFSLMISPVPTSIFSFVWFGTHILGNTIFAPLIITSTFLLYFFAPIYVCSFLEGNAADIKKEIYQKLIKTLKKHPEMKGDIQILSDHLDHQDVLETWWNKTNAILDQILDQSEQQNASENLNDLLNENDNILIEDPDAIGEPRSAPQHRRTIL